MMNRGDKVSVILRVLLIAVASLYCAMFLFSVSRRICYPFELEWIEGNMVDHVRHILSGHQLYAQPSFDFTADIYAPLYFYVSALVTLVTGVGFLPLRLVSLLATIGTGVMIYRLVRHETGSRSGAVIATGFFAACYPLTLAFGDVARVDSLSVFLLTAAVFLLRTAGSALRLAGAAALMCAAIFTKQSVLIIAAPLCLYSIACLPRRHRFVFPLVLAGLCAACFVFLQWSSNGWFLYYVFTVPQGHRVVWQSVYGFWLNDLLRPLPIAVAISCCVALHFLRTGNRGNIVFYLCWGAGAVVAAWMSRCHEGGAINVIMPVTVFMAYAVGLCLHILAPETLGRGDSTGSSEVPASVLSSANFVLLICLVQFLLRVYNPMDLVPTQADAAAGQKLLTLMRQANGEVYLAHHGYLPTMAGLKTYAHFSAMGNVMRSTADRQVAEQLESQIRGVLDSGKFKMIITDFDRPWFQPGPNYTTEPLSFENDAFYCRTGWRIRPSLVYRLKEPPR
jgi:hypothetical protein